MKRVALYYRVSTLDQHPENQLLELRAYAKARGFENVVEYVDHGVCRLVQRLANLGAAPRPPGASFAHTQPADRMPMARAMPPRR